MSLHLENSCNTGSTSGKETFKLPIIFRLAPNVVVYIPILKLAKRNIPRVMKNSDVSLTSTTLASNPNSIVTIQSILENNDE